MKKIFTFILLLFTFAVQAQVNLNFANPVDTGSGLNRVVVFPHVGIYNGLDLDMVVFVDGYYSSEPSDTNWYDDVDFRAISGDFNVKIPYTDTFTRCVDLTYKLVENGTTNCVYANLDATVYDLDSSQLRNEYISSYGFNAFSLFNPTSLTVAHDSNETHFFSSDEVNTNNMAGAVTISYDASCSFSITYCVTANNNGGNSGFFLSSNADSIYLLDVGDVILNKFAGVAEECVNYIYWDVKQEKNLENYVIQYSSDGIYFLDLVNILAESNSSYSYMTLVHGNDNYYRLKMNYIDETEEYSKIIYVKSDCIGQKTKVFPNPFNSSISITSDDDIQAVRLFSLSGEILMSVNVDDMRNISIDLRDIEARAIILKITYKGGITKILKLVKYL